MQAFLPVLLVIHIIACVALVITVMLQRSEGGALGMGGGGTGGIISGRGVANVLVRTTMGLAAVFFVTSVLMARLSTEAARAPSAVERELKARKTDAFDPLKNPITAPAPGATAPTATAPTAGPPPTPTTSTTPAAPVLDPLAAPLPTTAHAPAPVINPPPPATTAGKPAPAAATTPPVRTKPKAPAEPAKPTSAPAAPDTAPATPGPADHGANNGQ